MFKKLWCWIKRRHNLYADNKSFPKYLRCTHCSYKRLFRGGTIEGENRYSKC